MGNELVAQQDKQARLPRLKKSSRDIFKDLSFQFCDSCSAKGICPRYQQGSDCYYLKENTMPSLETSTGILTSIRHQIYLDRLRYMMALDREMKKDEPPSRDITSLSAAITRNIESLAKLSVHFGEIEAKPTDPEINLYIGQRINVVQIEQEIDRKIKQLKELTAKQRELESMDSIIDVDASEGVQVD